MRKHYPQIDIAERGNDPAGYDLVVNATPLGMNAADPLPFDPTRLVAASLRRRGRDEAGDHATPQGRERERLPLHVVGTDMLFEMIPAYLEFFGFGTATPDELRAVAKIAY